jgi:hypothetical protein
MIRLFKVFVLLLLVTTAVSCVSLTPYHMEVLRPAKITIPPDIKNLVLIDNIETLNDSFPVTVVRKTKTRQFLKSKPDSVTNSVINMLYQELNLRQFFDTVKLDRSSLVDTNSRSVVFPYDVNDFSSIKHQFNCDAALFLNHIRFKPVITVTEAGDYYYFTQAITGVIQWQLYDLRCDSLISTYVQRDTLFWDGYTPTLQYPVEGIPDMYKAMTELAKRMGFFCADQFAPYWEPVDRYYFATGPGYFSTATDFVLKKDWVEAEKVWFYIYNNSEKLYKARAAHNIALSKEVQGQFREAGEWALESLNQFKEIEKNYPDDYRREKKYYSDLAKRYVDGRKLVEQIGGE